MKKVKVTVVKTYIFKCPHCGYKIENPDTSSVMWTPEELGEYLDGRDDDERGTITCNFCDEVLQVEL